MRGLDNTFSGNFKVGITAITYGTLAVHLKKHRVESANLMNQLLDLITKNHNLTECKLHLLVTRLLFRLFKLCVCCYLCTSVSGMSYVLIIIKL